MTNRRGSSKVLIISDSHSYAGTEFMDDLDFVPDEIWHAGDIGSFEVVNTYSALAPLRAVYGNIDDREIRATFPEVQTFDYLGLKVVMIHIAGPRGKYNPRVRSLIEQHRPDIFICGHSHICVAGFDKKYRHLHINPGAFGKHGFHKLRTCIVLTINKGKPSNLKVLEYPR